MNDKERFHAVMNFEPPDRTLFWEQGYWGGTVERWYKEGMPRIHGVQGNPAFGDTVRGPATPIAEGDRICHDVRVSAGLDRPSVRVPVELFLYPGYPEQVLDEDEETHNRASQRTRIPDLSGRRCARLGIRGSFKRG